MSEGKEGEKKAANRACIHAHSPPSLALMQPLPTLFYSQNITYTDLERRGVTRRKHRPHLRAAQPPEGANVGLGPAGVDHDEGDEEAAQAVKEGKGVVIAFILGKRVEESRGKKRAMSGF